MACLKILYVKSALYNIISRSSLKYLLGKLIITTATQLESFQIKNLSLIA